jgi:hypothetical protein
MKMTPLLLTGAALLAIPATSLAHDASVACDQANPGAYVVTADYQRLNPVSTFTDTTVTVRWSDGYRVTLPLPPGCVAPPPVVPPVMPDLSPDLPPENNYGITPPAPPVVTPGAPERMPRKVAQPRKPVKVTCAYLKAHRAGKWSYVARGFYPFCRAPKPPKRFGPSNPFKGVTG